MARRVIEHFYFPLPKDVPLYEHQEALVMLRQGALYDRRDASDLQALCIECSNHLVANPFTSLVPGAASGDGEKILDIGMRYYTGCSVRQVNIHRALFMWGLIMDSDQEDGAPSVSNDLLARTFSCCAFAFFDLHKRAFKGDPVVPDPYLPSYDLFLLPTSPDPDPVLANDLLYLAAANADAAVRHGLVSPIVLHIAMEIVRAGEPQGVDPRKTTKYGRFTALWRAEEARMAELREEQRKMSAKVARAPNAYVCAALGCGIEGSKKSSLMRCAGKCPAERKPYYCSRDCQKMDWKTHKPFCKPDEQLALDEPPVSTTDIPLKHVGLDDAPANPLGYDGPERAIDVDLPQGGSMRILSKCLTPEMMRWMRDVSHTLKEKSR